MENISGFSANRLTLLKAAVASTLALRANFGVTFFIIYFTTNSFLNSLILSYKFLQEISDYSLSRTISLKV
jgi:hypothetical protein